MPKKAGCSNACGMHCEPGYEKFGRQKIGKKWYNKCRPKKSH